MNKLFRNNLTLKIISVFFALVLWGYVIGVTNPLRLKTIGNIPVKFINENVLTEQGFIPREILKDKNVRIRVTIEGKQRELGSIHAEDIEAVVDLKNVKGNSKKVDVKIDVKSAWNAVSVSPSSVQLEIDPFIKRTIPIVTQLMGNLREGYWRGDLKIDPETLVLAGAQSDIEKVEQAWVRIPLNQFDPSMENISLDHAFPIILVDAQNKEVKGNFQATVSSVLAKMPIYPKKLVAVYVDLVNDLIGKPATGYEVKGVDIAPANISIAARNSSLQLINRIGITTIDIHNAKSDIVKDASFVIPKGVELTDQQQVKVIVRIGAIEQEKTFAIATVKDRNLDTGLTMVRFVGSIDVVLKGPIELMKTINVNQIIVYADVSGLKKGTHEITLQAEIPVGVELISITPSIIQVKLQ